MNEPRPTTSDMKMQDLVAAPRSLAYDLMNKDFDTVAGDIQPAGLVNGFGRVKVILRTTSLLGLYYYYYYFFHFFSTMVKDIFILC